LSNAWWSRRSAPVNEKFLLFCRFGDWGDWNANGNGQWAMAVRGREEDPHNISIHLHTHTDRVEEWGVVRLSMNRRSNGYSEFEHVESVEA
jgi:hypothetical protein